MADIPAQIRVAVVGGGVVGCATAYELARAGFAVTLIERDALAAHASGRNPGNLNPLHGTPPELLPLTLAAFHRHKQIAAELAELDCGDFHFRPVERVHIGYDDTDRPHLEETAALANATPGFSATWIDTQELLRMEPRLARDVRFGLLTTGALSVDSYDFTRSLAKAAVQLGARYVNASVLGLTSSSDRVTSIRCDSVAVECDEVIFATGPWVDEINSWLGIGLQIEPVKGELLLLRSPGPAIGYDFTWGSICLYRRRHHEIWIGGTTSHSGCDATPTQAAKDFLMDNAARIMPAVRDARLLDHVAGLRPVPDPNTPIASRPVGWQNVTIANGGGYKGVLFSALIASKIRDLLLSGHSE